MPVENIFLARTRERERDGAYLKQLQLLIYNNKIQLYHRRVLFHGP